MLGQPCRDSSEQPFCTSADAFLALKCESGVWEIQETCLAGQRCNPSDGSCAYLQVDCAGSLFGSACFGPGVLYDCDTAPTLKLTRRCPFGCENAACREGGPDQLIVHTLVPYQSSDSRPPLARKIVVCLQGTPIDDERWSWIRDEVESTWGRYLGLEFIGFGACESLPTSGVIVRFEEQCRGRLVNDIAEEYLDPAGRVVPLGICSSYFDSQGQFEPRASENLIRFLARHQFAHVVHYKGDALPGVESVMRSGIELSRVAEYQISEEDFSWAASQIEDYSRKPSKAVVSAHGKCLTSVGGKLSSRTCAIDASEPGNLRLPSEQSWAVALGELFAPLADSASSCVGKSSSTSGAELSTGACDSSQPSWALAHVQWREVGRCAFPQTQPPEAGTALMVGRCEPPGSRAQSWRFDISALETDALVAQIRFSGDAPEPLCVTAADGGAAGAVVHLEPCAMAPHANQTFRLRKDGAIAIGDKCLYAGGEGAVTLGGCGLPWLVFGPVEDSEGFALTLSPGEAATATASKLNGVPTADQIFDFYF
jgi:hypothetical protein